MSRELITHHVDTARQAITDALAVAEEEGDDTTLIERRLLRADVEMLAAQILLTYGDDYALEAPD